MLSGAAREEKAQQWLERLQAWRAQGGSLAQFARSRGLQDFEAYRWQKILSRQGRWERAPAKPMKRSRSQVATQKFVRVRLAAPAASGSLIFRLRFPNGRSGELELRDVRDLAGVVAALESA